MADKLVQFLQGSPTTDIEKIVSQKDVFYLTTHVEGNKDSDRLYIGTSNEGGGVKAIKTPTPYGIKFKLNDNNITETFWTGEEDLTIDIEAVPNPATEGKTVKDNSIVRFDGTNGQIQDSSVLIDDSGNIETSGAISFKGDSYNTLLQSLTQTGNRTINIPDASGTLVTTQNNKSISGKALNINIKGAISASTSTTGSTYQPVYINSGSFTALDVLDSSSASAIGTNQQLVTERDIYYGLPTINNSHSYDSSTNIYAPTTGGTENYVLIGAGTTNAPTWTTQNSLKVGSATKATQDGDGKVISSTYETKTDATAKLTEAKAYTDQEITALVNGAPELLDTIGELAEAITENEEILTAVNSAIGKKSDKGHTHKITHTPTGTINEKSLTPEGTVTSTFTGTSASHSHTFTGTEASHSHTFTGNTETVNVNYTPAGTITNTFTGTEKSTTSITGTEEVGSSSHTHTVTAKGTISQPKFTGTKATIDLTYTPSGTISGAVFTGGTSDTSASSGNISVASSTHTHTYTPSGEVSQPVFTGSEVNSNIPSATSSVYSITDVGTTPVLSTSVTNKCLTLSFNAGTTPTRSSVTIPSAQHTHSVVANGTVSKPTFTGTEGTTTKITGTTPVAKDSHYHSVTATGSVSQSTFIGTEGIIKMEYTPSGTVSQPTFTGTEVTSGTPSTTTTVATGTHAHTYKPSGSVKSTFAGAEAVITSTYTPSGSISETALTPSGIISSKSLTPSGTIVSTFTGVSTTHDHEFTGVEATLTSTIDSTT